MNKELVDILSKISGNSVQGYTHRAKYRIECRLRLSPRVVSRSRLKPRAAVSRARLGGRKAYRYIAIYGQNNSFCLKQTDEETFVYTPNNKKIDLIFFN